MTDFKRLGDIATYINGYAFKPEDRGTEGLPIIRIQDLTGNSYDLGFYSGEYPERIEINNGDVLISWSGSLGVYLWNKGKALLNQHIFKVVFDKAEIDKSYFIYAIQHYLKEMEAKTHGATMKHITKKDFDDMLVPYPNMQKQRETAGILGMVDGIIVSCQQELAKLDELVKSRFVEMFGDPLTKTKYPKRQISDLGIVGTGNTPSMRVSEYYESEDIPFIRPGDIAESGVTIVSNADTAYISESARKAARIMPYNTVMVTCIGTIGKVGIVQRESACNQQINYIIPNALINSMYLAQCLSFYKPVLEEMANAPVVPIINKTQFSTVALPVPPLELQNRFAAFVAEVDKSKLAVKQSLEKLETLKKSLMQQYFG